MPRLELLIARSLHVREEGIMRRILAVLAQNGPVTELRRETEDGLAMLYRWSWGDVKE